MMKSVLLVCALLFSTFVEAETVTARVVADDYYKVFVGNEDGSSLTQVGGSGSATWQSQGASFNFELGEGQYIYVAAWDSASYGPPHAWIGEFNIGGTMLLSNTTDWVSKYDALIKDPSVTDVVSLIQSSMLWTAVAASMPNGSSPYGTVLGGSSASFIWHDTFNGTSASERGYSLYRAGGLPSSVPLPAAVWLFGSALLGFTGVRKARK